VEPYRWSLRVTSRDPDRATVFARKHQFFVGAPLSVDEQYPAVTALEYALAAVAGELVNGLKGEAKRRRIGVGSVEATLQASLEDVLAALGVVGATGQAVLQEVRIKVFAQSTGPSEEVRQLWDGLLERLPLTRTLRSAMKLEITLEVL